MKFAKSLTAVVAILAALQFVTTAEAQTEQHRNFPFGARTETSNPNQPGGTSSLTDRDGPWLIMARAFVGPDAEAKARNLAAEISAQNLKTYIYSHEFEQEQSYKGIGWDVVEVQGRKRLVDKRMRPLSDSSLNEVAVLVGDFPSVEDPRAQRVLETIKTMSPKSLVNSALSRDDDSVNFVKEVARKWATASSGAAPGPLRSAFMMPNPMLPEQYFAENRVDHYIMRYNRERAEYSLLDNPAPYTVRVATFRGATTFENEEIEETKRKFSFLRRQKRGLTESKLVEATAKATLLARELRKQGVEAYEFHDRHESYVCVGAFEYVSRKNDAGAEVYHPEIVEVINTYKAKIRDFPGVPGAIQPQYLESLKGSGVLFDAQPIPVAVPKPMERSAGLIRTRR